MHYEITNAIPDIIYNGIWIKEYQNYHGKVPGIVHIIASVKIKNQVYAIKLTIKKQNVLYKIGSVKYTKFNAYDVETKNEPVIGSTSADSRSKEVTPPQPIPITDSTLSVRDFLKNVNDKESSSRIRGIQSSKSYLLFVPGIIPAHAGHTYHSLFQLTLLVIHRIQNHLAIEKC